MELMRVLFNSLVEWIKSTQKRVFFVFFVVFTIYDVLKAQNLVPNRLLPRKWRFLAIFSREWLLLKGFGGTQGDDVWLLAASMG